MKKTQVRLDSRNRVCLTKISRNLAQSFYAYEKNGCIILEPLVEIPSDEAWLFRPENRKILKEIKESLKHSETVDRGSFSKYLK